MKIDDLLGLFSWCWQETKRFCRIHPILISLLFIIIIGFATYFVTFKIGEYYMHQQLEMIREAYGIKG